MPTGWRRHRGRGAAPARHEVPGLVAIRLEKLKLSRRGPASDAATSEAINRLTTSSAARVPDWLRMRQAIVRPLKSMLPIFMKRPLIAQYAICATCSHARPAEIGRNETRVLSLMFASG